MPSNTLANSSFLDAFGANLYTPQQYQTIAGADITRPADVQRANQALVDLFTTPDGAASIGLLSGKITVGLVLGRASDPASAPVLTGNWAERQAALSSFATPSDLWAKYGADPTQYNAVLNQVKQVVGADALATPIGEGYISSAADRTIWVTLDQNKFIDLFGTALLGVTPSGGAAIPAWIGNLTLNGLISPNVISGLWIESYASISNPSVLVSTPVSPPVGPLGIGNSATDNKVSATPAAIAANYNFPLPADVATGPIAVVEGNVHSQAQLFAAYNQYRQQVGLPTVTQEQFQVVSGTNDPTGGVISELALDISVIAGAAPTSTQLLYSYLSGTPYNAYQQVFFAGSGNQPAVLTSSYPTLGQSTPNSPFQWAWQQLFIDGVLANVSVHMAAGDEGASGAIANGAANVLNTHSSPYSLQVGGTSLSALSSALADNTIQSLAQLALQNDPGTIFPLVAAGLKVLPSHLSAAAPGPLDAASSIVSLFESVWQGLALKSVDLKDGKHDHVTVLESTFGAHQTGSGGLATGVAAPGYQTAFGLSALIGGSRATPDVAALAGGNTDYAVLNSAYVSDPTHNTLLSGVGGTSAAAPLWASLTAQFNAIFHDQGLPNLGFYNDLLYIAAAIAPGSFNDTQLGNNVNSFYPSATDTGYYNETFGYFMVPTGQGYSATAGYDLASGLGTPNGTLLARALTAIAHSQVSFSTSPPMLDDGPGGWTTGAAQGLLLQTVTSDGATVGVDHGADTVAFSSLTSSAFAWTARFAQQSLQPDFDPGLVLLFDKQAQGTVGYTKVAAGELLAVRMDGSTGGALQASLTDPFGFADFFSGNDILHISRAVAVAETVGGASDQNAVVRLRQAGENTLQLTLYKVDDFNGKIGSISPGEIGYDAAAQGRAYHTDAGATAIAGPGYGTFGETLLRHVDAGDIVAMRLDNLTSGSHFWGFANANETVNGQPVGHLWNYGLNTWGWEDMLGGGDHDFNDLVVQIDFTSASGHGWLV